MEKVKLKELYIQTNSYCELVDQELDQAPMQVHLSPQETAVLLKLLAFLSLLLLLLGILLKFCILLNLKCALPEKLAFNNEKCKLREC